MSVVKEYNTNHHAEEQDTVVLLQVCEHGVLVADLGQSDHNKVEATGGVLVYFFLQLYHDWGSLNSF
jgi:hypothetical protein